MNRNLIFAFLLLAALVMVNAYDIDLPCSSNPEGSRIAANLNPFPPVSYQTDDYTVEGAMLGYDIIPGKTEIIIVYADSSNNPFTGIEKVMDYPYGKASLFSIDVPKVPTPKLPSAYIITVTIADKTDDPNKPDIRACAYANIGF